MCEENSYGGTLAGHPVQQVHHVHPLPRVHPVERLVQQQHVRLVHERGGDPGPLSHALGERADPPVRCVGHLHQRERAACRGLRLRQLVQPGAGQDELPGGEEAVDRLPVGD